MAVKHLDINTASKDELTQLPAIDEERAQTLVSQRPFHNWHDIDRLPGFSPSLIEEIQAEGGYLGAQGEEMAQYVSQEEEEEERW